MADGALLLVDAKEGPMPQTRFVLSHALKLGLKIIVVINKIDKKGSRPDWVQGKTFDLFVELGANEETAFFPTVYASGKDGLAGYEPNLSKMTDITPIFDEIIRFIPTPSGDSNKPLQMLVSNIGKDSYKGRIAIGKIYNGKLSLNQEVIHINRDGQIRKCKLTSITTFNGLSKKEETEVEAGEIVAVTGISDITIGETIADINKPIALPLLKIEEPTVKMTFLVNDSPFAGKEGEFKTSSQIRERLYKELETDVALKVDDNSDGTWTVSGRGELHLGILVENMRREGYEFQVSRPRVIVKMIDGVKHEPYEDVQIDCPSEYMGTIIEMLGDRKGDLVSMNQQRDYSRIHYIMPSRGLIGFMTQFMTATKGYGILSHIFLDYRPMVYEAVGNRRSGALISMNQASTTAYAIGRLEDRGTMFLEPRVAVYEGMIVGESNKDTDLVVNVTMEKQLTNMRSSSKDSTVVLKKARSMNLEACLAFINDDELIEITPESIRLRKAVLKANERKRAYYNETQE